MEILPRMASGPCVVLHEMSFLTKSAFVLFFYQIMARLESGCELSSDVKGGLMGDVASCFRDWTSVRGLVWW